MSSESRAASPDGYNASQSDMWSVGVILYALLCSELPFDSDDMHSLVRLILKGVPRRAVPASRGAEARQLVGSLLSLDPSARPTAAQAIEAPWLSHAAESGRSSERTAVRESRSQPTTLPSLEAAAGEAPVAAAAAGSERRGLTQATEFFKALLAEERAERPASIEEDDKGLEDEGPNQAQPSQAIEEDEGTATRHDNEHGARAVSPVPTATAAAASPPLPPPPPTAPVATAATSAYRASDAPPRRGAEMVSEGEVEAGEAGAEAEPASPGTPRAPGTHLTHKDLAKIRAMAVAGDADSAQAARGHT